MRVEEREGDRNRAQERETLPGGRQMEKLHQQTRHFLHSHHGCWGRNPVLLLVPMKRRNICSQQNTRHENERLLHWSTNRRGSMVGGGGGGGLQ